MDARLVEDLDGWCVLDRQALLSALADVFLVRRAADKHDGEGLQQPHVQKVAQRHLSIVFGVGTQELLQRVQGHPCLSVEELVRAVQIGWETTDATTRLHDAIMKRASSKNSSLWAYFLSFFGACLGRENRSIRIHIARLHHDGAC